MNIAEIREKYPQYNEVSDGALLYGFYKTTPEYQKMPMGEYADKLGMTSTQFKEMITAAKESGVTPTTSSGPEGVGNEVITGFSHQDQSFVNPNMQPMGDAEGLLSSAAQGITMGFSDELFGQAYALTETLGGSDLSWDDLYTRMKNFEEKRVMDYRRTDPKKAFASEVGGAVATSIAVSPALMLLKSPKFLADLSKGTKAFLTSGGVGAIYGTGTGEQGERGENALKVGTLSAFGGWTLQKAGGFVSNTYDRLTNKVNKSPSLQNLKELKNAAYTKAKELGIKFDSTVLEKFKILGRSDAIDEGYDEAINKHTKSALDLFESSLEKWKTKGASFEQLDGLSRQLWAKLKESGNTEVRIYKLITAVNNLIKSHPDTSTASMAAKSANRLYNKAKTFDWEFTKALNNDKITGNLGQKYKAAVRNILNNKRLRAEFDEPDIAAMESFLKGKITDSMLKSMGKLSPTSGALPAFVTLASLVATGGHPILALAIAGSIAAKSSFNKRATQGADKLMNYIKQFKPDTTPIPGIEGFSAVGSGQALETLSQ